MTFSDVMFIKIGTILDTHYLFEHIRVDLFLGACQLSALSGAMAICINVHVYSYVLTQKNCKKMNAQCTITSFFFFFFFFLGGGGGWVGGWVGGRGGNIQLGMFGHFIKCWSYSSYVSHNFGLLATV